MQEVLNIECPEIVKWKSSGTKIGKLKRLRKAIGKIDDIRDVQERANRLDSKLLGLSAEYRDASRALRKFIRRVDRLWRRERNRIRVFHDRENQEVELEGLRSLIEEYVQKAIAVEIRGVLR